MKKQLMIVGITLVLIAINLIGCITSEVVTTDEIKENFFQAIEDVTSYKYSADVTATHTIINESGTNITETDAIQNGIVDIANKKLRQNNIGTTTGVSEEQCWTVYIIDNILYSSYSNKKQEGETEWSTNNISHTNDDMTWKGYSALELLVLYLENELKNVKLEQLADEVDEGTDCHVLYLTAFENQSGEGSDMSPIFGNASYEYEIKYWIAKDTYFLIRAQSRTTSDMSGWFAFGEADRSITVSEMDILYYDYNVPVTIDLPPEKPDVQLMGYVNIDGIIVIGNMGGGSLENYRIDVKDVNGTLIDTITYQNVEDIWEVGENKYLSYIPILNEGDEVRVTIYSIHDECIKYVLFDGLIRRT